MAYTKILHIKVRLDQCVDYAKNPEKTTKDLDHGLNYIEADSKTEKQFYVSCFGCQKETAYSEMIATRFRWKKDSSRAVRLGYHIIQSFKPGEADPQMVHNIGAKFARRFLADTYEVVVSTHLDKEHLHNHIVFNAVSYVDGKMFRDKFCDLDAIRETSDKLCHEYALSVIETNGKGKHYAEWKAEKGGKPTFRSTLKADIDRLIPKSYSFERFVKNLEAAGYKVRYKDRKHMKVIPPGGEKGIRLDSLKDQRYTEQGIRERILRQVETGELETAAPEKMPTPKRKPHSKYKCAGSYKNSKRIKLHGFRALYFRYLYKLGKVRKKQYPIRKNYSLIPELQKFNRYVSQFNFLHSSGIETVEQLRAHKAELAQQISMLTEQRLPLYALRRTAADNGEAEYISKEIAELTSELRNLRYEVRQCKNVESDAPRLQEQKQVQQTEENIKEEKEHERRIRSG